MYMRCALTIIVILFFALGTGQLHAQDNESKESDNAAKAADEKRPDVELTEEALKIHHSGMLFDGHNDLPFAVRMRGNSSFDNIDISELQTDSGLHTDIPRLKKRRIKSTVLVGICSGVHCHHWQCVGNDT